MFSLDELRDAHEVVKQALRPTPAFAWPPRARRRDASRIVLGSGAEIAAAGRVFGQRPTMSRRRRRIAMKD